MGNPADISRRLNDLQLEQVARRGVTHLKFELDEVAAIRKLAVELFGPIASIHVDASMPGVFQLGYFTEPPSRTKPDGQRRRRVVFRGRTITELLEQVRLWRSRR